MSIMRRYLDLLEVEANKTIKSWTFYHGTRLESDALKIIKEGILKPGITVPDNSLKAPVTNKVYLTTDLAYALSYSLESLMPGYDVPNSKITEDGYAYLFVIDGETLGDIQPDEDSIGIFLEQNTEETSKGFKFIGDKSKREVWDFIWNTMTDKQKHGSVRGLSTMQASGGKLVLETMPDWIKTQMIEWGSYVANEGDIEISEAWKIEKIKAREFKEDAANFFSLAHKLKLSDYSIPH